MTVVRNEFEMSENNGARVLRSRVRAAAMPWHNYGRSVIGIKADIELVPIENLKDFYRRYYQPDNAVLVLAGRFDEGKAFKSIAATFGKLPKPKRALPTTFTTEPVQDGERSVIVRRVGGTPALNVAWRIPASTDPDYPALMVLQGVLGDEPQGRLHQALVDTKKAASRALRPRRPQGAGPLLVRRVLQARPGRGPRPRGAAGHPRDRQAPHRRRGGALGHRVDFSDGADARQLRAGRSVVV